MAESETKVCPDCAEAVKTAARKCRFCGYEFAPSSASNLASIRTALPSATPARVSVHQSEVSDLLERLVEKSLVQYDAQTDRFRLLESVNEYARERLRENGEDETTRRR